MNPVKHLLIFLLLVPALRLYAQDGAPYQYTLRQPARIEVMPVYQSFDIDGRTLTEFTVPVRAFVPLGRNHGLTFLGGSAGASGDGLADLSSVTDVQIALSGYYPMGGGSLVANLGVNLPSGKIELTPEEFQTAVLFGQYVFDFDAPVFGQGLNVAPGLTYAHQIAPGLAAGLSAAYQYRGPFKPLVDMQDDYDPGDEVTLAAGLDVRLASVWSVSGDVGFTRYAADRVGEADTYTSGNRISVTLGLLGRPGFNTLRLIARHRIKEKSEAPGLGQTFQVIPNLSEAFAEYRARLTATFFVTGLARARRFAELDACADPTCRARTYFDLGLMPEVRLAPALTLALRGTYRAGDLTGFELGGGLIYGP